MKHLHRIALFAVFALVAAVLYFIGCDPLSGLLIASAVPALTPNQTGPGTAASPRSSMLPPNIFDPRTDGSDYYWYVTNIAASIAAAGVSNSQIQIDAGTDFYWIASSYQIDTSGGALTESTNILPLITVLINDTGSARNLMNSATPLTALAGDGKRPYRLVRPRIFRANSVINFTWTNYSNSTTYSDIYFTMHGYRRLVQPPGLVS